jgi:hypothetical protein
MKIRPVGAEIFLADRRTDLTKLTVAFRNFYERRLKKDRVTYLLKKKGTMPTEDQTKTERENISFIVLMRTNNRIREKKLAFM